MDLALLVTVAAASALLAAGLVVVRAMALAGRRLQADLRATRADLAAFQVRLDALARDVEKAPARTADESSAGRDDYLITSLAADTGNRTGTAAPGATTDARRLSGGEFVTVAVGESLVRVVSVAYGVRRAMSPQSRNRIRFAMRREVKRSQKQRRRDLKEAKRQLRVPQPPGRRPDLAEDAA